MKRTEVAKELVAMAKDVVAMPMVHVDPGVEIRGSITKTLRVALKLDGRSMQANPTFSALLRYESWKDETGTDSNKFHYFAVYQDFDRECYVGGNAWGRLGYPTTYRAMEVARGDERSVLSAIKSKMSTKTGKGYEQVTFMK